MHLVGWSGENAKAVLRLNKWPFNRKPKVATFSFLNVDNVKAFIVKIAKGSGLS